MPKINSLYELIKQESQKKHRPLKVISDWDEVLQARLPVIIYEFYKAHINTNRDIKFEEFFKTFWEKALVTYNDHRHTLKSFKVEDGIYGEINQFIRSKPDEFKKIVKEISQQPELYNNPFLSIGEDLLLCLKENLINLVICTTYKEEREKSGGTGGDPRKKNKFEEKFGTFSNANLDVSSFLIEGKKHPIREKWIKENHSDFDIFIDDNPNNIARTKELFSSDKIYVMPKCGDNNFVEGENIHYVTNNLSKAKEEKTALKNNNHIKCLHCLIKQVKEEKERKIKIVCDWNDVIQDAVSYPLWDIEKKVVTYEDYFQKFWSEYEGNLYWRKGEKLNESVNKYWKDPEYFNKIPFLSPAKELLLALKEGLIEELIFLSSYSERIHLGGDTRKLKRFETTFGKFPQVKGLELIPARGDSKGQWLSENYPDFDIFIDDSPKKILGVSDAFPDRTYALPLYKCNEHVQGENVYHFEAKVSDLKVEEFVALNSFKEEQLGKKDLVVSKERELKLQTKIELLPK